MNYANVKMPFNLDPIFVALQTIVIVIPTNNECRNGIELCVFIITGDKKIILINCSVIYLFCRTKLHTHLKGTYFQVGSCTSMCHNHRHFCVKGLQTGYIGGLFFCVFFFRSANLPFKSDRIINLLIAVAVMEEEEEEDNENIFVGRNTHAQNSFSSIQQSPCMDRFL